MPTTKRDGAEIYYTIDDLTPPWRTEPETIIFHHGIGTDHRIWSDWVPALADAYRVVRIDVRGYGGSSARGPEADWSMDDLISDVIAVADAVGADRFHMVGESLGGTATYATAIAHPERLLSITPICAGYEGAYIREVDHWRAEREATGMATWSMQMMDHRFKPGAITHAQWTWFEQLQIGTSPIVTVGLVEMLMGVKITDALAGISMPTLILHPDSSPFLPVEVPRGAHKIIAQSELHIFEAAKHGIAFSHARESALLVRNFIDRAAIDRNADAT